MDWTTLLANSPFAGLLNAPGNPTSSAANAPMNIVPQVAQTTPTAPAATQPGILNGNSNDMMAQGLKMIQGGQSQQTPAMPQIQMARPVGSAAGFDPSRILAAIRGQSMPVT